MSGWGAAALLVLLVGVSVFAGVLYGQRRDRQRALRDTEQDVRERVKGLQARELAKQRELTDKEALALWEKIFGE